MSVKHLVHVWERSPEKGAALLVLMALADYADEDGNARVSVAALADRARVSPRHVTSLLRELTEGGAVQVKETGGGDKRAVYSLASPAADVGVRVPEKAVRSAPTSGLVRDVFAYWVKTMGKNGNTTLDDKRTKAIQRALKVLTVEDCYLAVEGCAVTPHNMGKNDAGIRYDDLTIIFRDASHWERFMETGKRAGRKVGPAPVPETDQPRLSPAEQQAINLAGIKEMAQAIGRPGTR